jgi:Tfp pilus assembly protein PilN
MWIGLAVGLAIVVPIVGIGVMQHVKVSNLRSDIAMAETDIQQLKPQVDKIRALMKERAEINQCLLTVQGLARDRYLPIQLMDELAYQTPDYLWLTKVTHGSAGNLRVEGQTFSNILVAELMTRMEEGDMFEDVSLAVSERRRLGAQGVINFTLDTRIKP